MSERQQVSLIQAAILITTSAWGGTFYLFREIIARSGRAGWLAQAVSCIPVMFLAFWLVSLTKSYPEQTILEILQQTTGKWVGNLFCWLYGLIIGVLSFLNLMQFSMMVKLYLLQVSPIYFPALLTIVTSAIIASKGIEPLARSAVICIPTLVAIAAGVVLIGGVGFFEWANVTPIFERDAKAFLSGMFISAGLIGELLLFLMVMVKFFPNPAQKAKQIALFAINPAVIPAAVDFMVIGIFTPEETRRALFLAVAFTQTIKYGTFLQWMDIFFFIIFVMGVVFKLGVNLYSGQVVMGQVFGTKRQQIVLIALASVIFILCFFTPSMDEVDYYYLLMAQYVVWPYVVTCLTLTTLGVWLKNRHSRRWGRS